MSASIRFVGIEDAPPGYHVPLVASFEVRRADGGEYHLYVAVQLGEHGWAGKNPVWGWDGNREAPTLTPSIRSPLGQDGLFHCFLQRGVVRPCGDNQLTIL